MAGQGEEIMNDKQIETFRRYLRNGIESAQMTLDQFVSRVTENQIKSSAFEWSLDAFEAAAVIDVHNELLKYADEHYPETIRKELSSDILRSARSPSRSTSPTSNLMEEVTVSAKAKALLFLGPLSPRGAAG